MRLSSTQVLAIQGLAGRCELTMLIVLQSRGVYAFPFHGCRRCSALQWANSDKIEGIVFHSFRFLSGPLSFYSAHRSAEGPQLWPVSLVLHRGSPKSRQRTCACLTSL